MYQGTKIRLRSYRKEDVPMALAYINDEEVKGYLMPGIPYPLTLEEEEKWYYSQSAFKDTYSFAIETLDDGKYIGGCGVNHVDWKNSVVEVGIFIGDKGYWGKGYGTDAMSVLIRFIFEQMNVHKIKLQVYSFNSRAIKSYEKCGFKQEGVLRHEIFRHGQYHDKVVMGILRDEFPSCHTPRGLI